VGPLETPAGRVPPTGQRVDLRVIDILTLTDGRISSIWMVADWLTALTAAGALRMPVAPVMP
jgi:predicted ester cyclase